MAIDMNSTNWQTEDGVDLRSLDSETLQRILMGESGDDSTDQLLDENCTETFWNVTLVPRDLRNNVTYVLVYINWMNFLVNLMFPLATLLTLNLSVYKSLKKLHVNSSSSMRRKSTGGETKHQQTRRARFSLKRQSTAMSKDVKSVEDEEGAERDARCARASIIMVLAFGLCHTPRLITNTVEMFMDKANSPAWVELLVCVNHLLVTINSSFNFLIYLMASKRKPTQGATCASSLPRMHELTAKPRTKAGPKNSEVVRTTSGVTEAGLEMKLLRAEDDDEADDEVKHAHNLPV